MAPKSNNQEFEKPQPGSYLARCVELVDLGTQHSESPKYGAKVNQKIILGFEIIADEVGTPVRDGNNETFVVRNEFTFSMSQNAHLRKALETWTGAALTADEADNFDFETLLGKLVVVQLSESTSAKGTVYINITAYMATKRTGEGVRPLVLFTLGSPDMTVFSNLPKYIQNKIQESDEWVDVDQATAVFDKPVTPAPASTAPGAVADKSNVGVLTFD